MTNCALFVRAAVVGGWFILTDADRRLFALERYCFRGSVDDWIAIGPVEQIDKLAVKYLKATISELGTSSATKWARFNQR